MTKADQEKKNQFGTGLIMGFLLGSTSYFLFNTDKGQELKENFKKKWQEVQTDMPSLSEFKIGDLAIKDLINVLLGLDSVDKIGHKKTGLIKEANRRQKGSKNQNQKKFKGT
jgi:gas vesicle protein